MSAQTLLVGFILLIVVYHIVWVYFKLRYNRNIYKEYLTRQLLDGPQDNIDAPEHTNSEQEINDIRKALDCYREEQRTLYYLTDMVSIPEILYDEYQVFLRSGHWKSLRRVTINRDGHRCTKCGYIGALQVHHVHYRGIFEMSFSVDQLITLCEECHKDEHIRLKDK